MFGSNKFANVEDVPEFDNHKMVAFFGDKSSGLRAFVAIYNNNHPSSVGGTRMWPYKNEMEAMRDALNLSKAMAYKCAIAGLPFGGAKGVIIGDAKKQKTQELLLSYAERVNLLGGKFITGTDSGLEDADVQVMKRKTSYMIGEPEAGSDSPSLWAARGTLKGLEVTLKKVFGNATFAGRSFAIQGLGKTGMELARLIMERGGSVTASEIDPEKIAIAKQSLRSVKIVEPRKIAAQEVDVFCPCSMGHEINKQTIKQLKCKIVAGVANNQLENSKIGDALYKKEILYAPDYAINAGGLMRVLAELDKGGYKRDRVLEQLEHIPKTLEKIFERSEKEKTPTHRVAAEMAEAAIKKA